jgi:pSer/pThr/pTyr-binding forkhead associated (FHA) protein
MRLTAYKNNQPIGEYKVDLEAEDDSMEVFIGRSEDCHLVIDDPQISREHAVIVHENGKWILNRLTDIGTIIINGQSIQEKALEESEVIDFGGFNIQVSELAPKTLVEAASEPEAVIESPIEESIVPDETMDDLASADEIPQDMSFEEESTDIMEEPQAEESIDNELGDIDEVNEPEVDNLDNEFSDESNDVGDELSLDSEQDNEESVDDFSSDNNSDDTLSGGDAEFDPGEENNEGFGDDDGFGDDSGGFGEETEGGFGGGSDDSGDSTQVFSHFASYEFEIFGEHAPYDRFVVEDNEIFIGRDQEKCKIVLDDHEVSTVHAKIKKTKINLLLEDLNSTNGTILNGARVNKSELNNGDEFIIGSTTFTVRVKSDMLEEESETLMPVEENQTVEVEQSEQEAYEEQAAQGDFAVEPAGDFSVEGATEEKSILKNPEKRKKLMYGVVGALLLWVLLDDGEEPKKKTEGSKGKGKQEKVAGKDGQAPIKKAPIEKKNLSPEDLQMVSSAYDLAYAYASKGDYARAKEQLDIVVKIDKNFRQTPSLLLQVNEGLAELERLEKERQERQRRAEIKAKVKELLEKARKAFKDDTLDLSEQYINQIVELDPENIEVQDLRLQIDDLKEKRAEEERIEREKKERRQRMEDALVPGKTFYLQEQWHKATLKLQEFLSQKGLDDDLIKSATKMLQESKEKLRSQIDPLLGKARALKEGQDMKGAYETYKEILDIDPTNEEALIEMNKITEDLELRAKKVYREAIISESLSLFDEAKEKFQEVQQISPSDSEYYKKATEKLKEYLD